MEKKPKNHRNVSVTTPTTTAVPAQHDSAAKYFNCTDRERAAFEAGIKLGSLFHQFIGTPITVDNVADLENAITKSVRVQPFVKDVRVRIHRELLTKKKHHYDYNTLTGEMLNVILRIKYKDITLKAQLDFKGDLNYPLMYISAFE